MVFIWYPSITILHSKNEILALCCFDVVPASTTLAQHYNNTQPTSPLVFARMVFVWFPSSQSQPLVNTPCVTTVISSRRSRRSWRMITWRDRFSITISADKPASKGPGQNTHEVWGMWGEDHRMSFFHIRRRYSYFGPKYIIPPLSRDITHVGYLKL